MAGHPVAGGPLRVLGWFGKHNIGDEAYKRAYPEVIRGRPFEFLTPQAMGDFSAHPDRGDEVILLGGGDVVKQAFTASFRRRPGSRPRVVSATVTAGSEMDFLRSCEKVWVRDRRSLAVCRDRGVDAAYLPDLTFALQPDAARGRRLIEGLFHAEGRELYEKVVVVVLNAHLAAFRLDDLGRDQADFLKVTQEMARVFDDADASFLYVPFSTAMPFDDRMTNAFLASRCKWYRKNLVVHDRWDVQTALDVIAGADACVSSRLHSTIFATIGGTPFVDVTHHDKNLGFVETVGLEDLSVPYWDFPAGRFRGILDAALAGGREPFLRDSTREARRMLADVDLLG